MELGGPQIGEVTCGGSPHLSCKRDQIKMRDYVDRRVTHQSGLPHLPGVPHLHVNRPLDELQVTLILFICYKILYCKTCDLFIKFAKINSRIR